MKRTWFRRAVHCGAVVATIVMLTLWQAREASAAMSDCLDATCRIRCPSGDTGTGCVFEISQGRVFVLTCAHVVENAAVVQCTFWRAGHESLPIAGEVQLRNTGADAAVLSIPVGSFGRALPKVVPLAPAGDRLPAGETITSVGCANGTWATSWKGHVIGYDQIGMKFVPAPANGRSGSAIFDGQGQYIVGLLRARNQDDSQGIATPVSEVRRVFGSTTKGEGRREKGEGGTALAASRTERLTQCGPGGCGPVIVDGSPSIPTERHYLLPYREKQRDQQMYGGQGSIYPTLPTPAPVPTPAPAAVDFGPVLDRLDRLATGQRDILDALRHDGASAGPQAPTPAAPVASVPMIDQEAREGVGKALVAIEAVNKTASQAAADAAAVKKDLDEAKQGFATMKENTAKHGTLMERITLDAQKVREDFEREKGREPTKWEERIGVVKELIEGKVAGLAGAHYLPLLLAGVPAAGLIGWLIARDVRSKITTGDPLAVEKLASLVHSQFSGLHDKLANLKEHVADKLDTAAAKTPTTTIITTPAPAAGASAPPAEAAAPHA